MYERIKKHPLPFCVEKSLTWSQSIKEIMKLFNKEKLNFALFYI